MKLFLQAVVLITCVIALGCAGASVALEPIGSARPEAYKIPGWYYDSPCLKPAHLTFYDWMATLEMPPYETDVFDCSQMAAYIEWLSENCNHRATIAGKAFEGYGHLWVMVDIGGVPFAYEATEIRWVPREGKGSTHFHYDPDTEWEDIYDAPWEHDYFKQEYAWWLVYSDLKGENDD